MEKIKEIFALISSYIEMGLNHVLDFLSKDLYILYGAIAVVLLIVVVAGLIACFKKIPRLFIIIVILLAIIVVAWYFLIYKTA
ncbi:MAG: hypothetical protein K6E74_04950 [Bacilli bacterium]|nr:hypothetical protein [Bacilli bacterium]